MRSGILLKMNLKSKQLKLILFRVYKIEMESLKSLFRLFRGKKLNPLRARIDSYSYNVEQLFIGTLSFCIVFFLFPTIFMYYIVFLSVI